MTGMGSFRRLAPALAAVLMAAACHPHGPAHYPTLTLDGVAMSSAAGPPPAGHGTPPTGAAAGTLFAAFIGPDVSPLLARADRAQVERALIRAYHADVGTAVEWQTPETGHHGTVTPIGLTTGDGGQVCRGMRLMVSASDRRAGSQQWACQQPDGTWSRGG